MSAGPGARVVVVSPERLSRWLSGFSERHGDPVLSFNAAAAILRSPDGAVAEFGLPWGPVRDVVALADSAATAAQLDVVVAEFTRARRVGALIVHKRGHAVGEFLGDQLVRGAHHSHYVQSRTKAGGWSQQRYARRRANQADRAYAAAADDAASIVAGVQGLSGLATGGDQAGVDLVLADPRLAGLRALPRLRVGGVPDPNAGVLLDFGKRYREVRIVLNEHA